MSGAHHCIGKGKQNGTTGTKNTFGIFAQTRPRQDRSWLVTVDSNTHLAEPHIWDSARQTLVVDKAEATAPSLPRGCATHWLFRGRGCRKGHHKAGFGRCRTEDPSRLGVEGNRAPCWREILLAPLPALSSNVSARLPGRLGTPTICSRGSDEITVATQSSLQHLPVRYGWN